MKAKKIRSKRAIIEDTAELNKFDNWIYSGSLLRIVQIVRKDLAGNYGWNPEPNL
jgi:hypothetical protein